MAKKADLHQRRDFFKLAAFTGAAALAGRSAPADAEQPGAPLPVNTFEGESKMELLRVSGRQIIDAKGSRVRLRGTCPGGWMNMEDFINGHPGAEHTLRAQTAEVLGPAKATFFFERMLDYFFNEDDIVFPKQAGASVVRFPLNYRQFEHDAAPFKYKESGFARLDKVLRHCENHDLYVILDLHRLKGGKTSIGILTTHRASACCGQRRPIRTAMLPSGESSRIVMRIVRTTKSATIQFCLRSRRSSVSPTEA